MDKRSDVPKLDTANYGPWFVAIRAAAHTIDCINHITGNPELPQEPNHHTDFQRNKHFLIGKIISSIPPEIANLIITPTGDPTPFQLITAITAHPDSTNTSDHKYLKQLAENPIFLPNMTLSQYVTAHETIRTKMIAARYPSISDPRTTVEFLIDGLRFNPVTCTVVVQLISLDPQDVKDFVHKFNRITSYAYLLSKPYQYDTRILAHHYYKREPRHMENSPFFSSIAASYPEPMQISSKQRHT